MTGRYLTVQLVSPEWWEKWWERLDSISGISWPIVGRLAGSSMDEGRTKRLVHAGFTPEQARLVSELHTPNVM